MDKWITYNAEQLARTAESKDKKSTADAKPNEGNSGVKDRDLMPPDRLQSRIIQQVSTVSPHIPQLFHQNFRSNTTTVLQIFKRINFFMRNSPKATGSMMSTAFSS